MGENKKRRGLRWWIVEFGQWPWRQFLLELWMIGLRIRVLGARLLGRAVVLDADYYRLAIDDFHVNLLRDKKIRRKVLIAQVPRALCIGSLYAFFARRTVDALTFEQLLEFRWEDIHLLEAYRTKICGDAGRLDFLNSPLVDAAYLRDQFYQGMATYAIHRRLAFAIKPNAVIVFQGAYGMSRLFDELRQRYNVHTVAIENSFLGDRVYFDGYSGMILNRFSMAKLGREYREARPADPSAGAKAYAIWEAALKQKIADHRTTGITDAGEFRAKYGFDIGRPFALILAQVQVDASILLGSPFFPDSVDFIMDSIQACRDLGIPVVVRFHPREERSPSRSGTPPNPSYEQVLARLGGEVPSEVCLVPGTGVDTFLLVRHARMGITLNSQAGLEMALHGKAVVTAAECSYARKGFTWDLGHPCALHATVEDAWVHSLEQPTDDRIRESASQFVLDMTATCMPLRAVEGSEDLVLTQLGLIHRAAADSGHRMI